jgi:hypothetical protein
VTTSSGGRIVADAAATLLLAAVTEGAISPGVPVDLARRIADRAAAAGVSLDDLLELTTLGTRV